MVVGRSIRAGGVFVELTTKDSKLVKGLRSAQAKLRQFGQAATAIGKQFLAAATVAAAPIALATRTFASFSDQMLKVQAVTGGAEKGMKSLNEQAKLLGRTTSFTASEVASAMVELGRAGFERGEIDDAIESVLDLARATDTELATAAQIAASTMRQFNLAASDTTSTADILTRTANGSAQTLEDLAEALKLAAPIASAAGDDLTATAAAIGILANNGIRGSMAGTALARAYKNLASLKTDALMKRLGIAVQDAAGNMRPLADIISDIGKQTQTLGSKGRLSIFEQLFGRGSAAALKLARAGAKFDDMVAKIRDAGTTARSTAKIMDKGLGGAFRLLKSAAEGVQIAIGEALEKDLQDLGKALTDVANDVTKWIRANKELVKLALKVIAAVAAIGVGLLALGLILKVLAVGIGLVTGAFALFGTIVGTVTGLLAALVSPIGLVVAAIAGLIIAFVDVRKVASSAIGGIKRGFAELKAIFAQVAGGISDALKADDLKLAAEILFAGLAVVWQKGVNELKNIWDQLLIGADKATRDFADDFGGALITRLIRDFFKLKAAVLNVWDNMWSVMRVVAAEALRDVKTLVLELLRVLPKSMGGLDDDTVDAGLDKIDAAHKAKLAAIESERKAATQAVNDDRDNAIAAEKAKHDQTMKDLRSQSRARADAAKADGELQRRIRDNLEGLAKQRLRDLEAKAKAAAKDVADSKRTLEFKDEETATLEITAAPDPLRRLPEGSGQLAAFDLLEKVVRDIQQAAPGATEAAAGTVRGTFAGGAVGRLGVAQDRVQTELLRKAEEQLQANLRALVFADIGAKALREIAVRTGLR